MRVMSCRAAMASSVGVGTDGEMSRINCLVNRVSPAGGRSKPLRSAAVAGPPAPPPEPPPIPPPSPPPDPPPAPPPDLPCGSCGDCGICATCGWPGGSVRAGSGASGTGSGKICVLIANPMMPTTTAPRMSHPTRLPKSRSPGCGDGPLPRCGGGWGGPHSYVDWAWPSRTAVAVAMTTASSTRISVALVMIRLRPRTRHSLACVATRTPRHHACCAAVAKFCFQPLLADRMRRAFALLFASVAPRTRGRAKRTMVVDESRYGWCAGLAQSARAAGASNSSRHFWFSLGAGGWLCA